MNTDTNQNTPNPGDKPQSKGGRERWKGKTAEEKSAIAKAAIAARWVPKAIHRGNFKDQFGFDAECYVLNDANKTAVISQSGMGRALGLAVGGTAFPRFLATKAISSLTAGAGLDVQLSQPLKFQWGTGGGEMPPATVHGFDVTLLIDLCRIITDNAEKLGSRNARVVANAHVILGASAKSGIRSLVYALAGYNPTAAEVIEAFKAYVQEEAKKYEKEFPPELYQEWHRLYNIPVLERGRSWHFKHLTINHIYYPLAKSNGKLLTLLKAAKASGGDARKKLFQFLNEVGARALRIQLGRVLEMAESSADKPAYEKKTLDRFGGQTEFVLMLPPLPQD